MRYKIVFRRRYHTGLAFEALLPVLSVMAALFLAGMALAFFGVSPLKAYIAMFRGALGSWYGFGEVIVKGIPLVIAGVAVALAFRMKIWNIGAEGQIYAGALAATAAVRYLQTDSRFAMLVLMIMAAFLAGGFWGGVAGYL
ncbi:MAG TPA: ABC transporter permease, partial [Synergistetes bacterium]|nr:ABC transporter permease [Synergistota bacterium]